ncbi:THAP domain-containing 11 [Paramuricea clavata]|uniref:THAP domain-containing 11 n=1 Tax=Paramuricea clavata TaxID=317549 RepID=A0A7D9I230_PARCT|nr:THAP domain-containing 11 [Paramuricea clavata]
MPSNARCAVGCCDNDRRYPDLWVKRSHVETLRFHKWPKDEKAAEMWRKQVLKGRKDDFNPNPGASGTFVCSNHFPKGKQTPGNPDTDYPSMFLTLSDYQSKPSQTKRKTGTKRALDTD